MKTYREIIIDVKKSEELFKITKRLRMLGWTIEEPPIVKEGKIHQSIWK